MRGGMLPIEVGRRSGGLGSSLPLFDRGRPGRLRLRPPSGAGSRTRPRPREGGHSWKGCVIEQTPSTLESGLGGLGGW